MAATQIVRPMTALQTMTTETLRGKMTGKLSLTPKVKKKKGLKEALTTKDE